MTRFLAGAASVAAALLLAPSPSTATSFDCRLAALPAEIAICNDGMLGALDEEMARQYYTLINIAPPDAVLQIRAEQRAWLRGRNLCFHDRQCVAGAYRHRLQQLGAWRELVGGPPGFGPGPYDDEEGPPPGFYDDGAMGSYDDEDEEDYPPGFYDDEEEVVPFEDPDDYYFGPGG